MIIYFDLFSFEDGYIYFVEVYEVDKIKLVGDFIIEKVFLGLFYFYYNKFYFMINLLFVFVR